MQLDCLKSPTYLNPSSISSFDNLISSSRLSTASVSMLLSGRNLLFKLFRGAMTIWYRNKLSNVINRIAISEESVDINIFWLKWPLHRMLQS